MEAKHKTKEKLKKAIREQESSSDGEDLSDFDEVIPTTVQDSAFNQSQTYFTPTDKTLRLVVILDNVCLETA